MKISYQIFSVVFLLGLFLAVAPVARAQIVLQPATEADFETMLKALANDHVDKKWCEENCAQIRTFKLSGRIADGTLTVEVTGDIIGKRNGVVPLFLSSPPAEIMSLKSGEAEVSLVFANKTYYTVLSPGPFTLSGQIHIDRTTSTNFTLPAAVGRVVLDIEDQETLLKNVPAGQVGGSFQVTPTVVASDEDRHPALKNSLRLDVLKHFTVSRDKAFSYTVDVMGAQDGQVISIPLTDGEKVLKVVPDTAVIKPNQVEFTAGGATDRFVIEGEWTKTEIALSAEPGPVQETWEMSCEGAFDCHFDGDAEKVPGAAVHRWAPVAGQKLAIHWEELNTLKAQSLVAQTAVLQTETKGKGVRQTLGLELTSSARDQLYVQLPAGAVPLNMTYGGSQPEPMLKNEKGWVHLTIPQGSQTVQLVWEINESKGFDVPLPKLDVPVGKWVFWSAPQDAHEFVWAGGLPGSPVVLYWPRLGFCLLIGFLFLFAEKKFFGERKTSAILFLVLCAGFALAEPAMILVFLTFLIAARLLYKAQYQRTVLGRAAELLILLGITGMTLGAFVFVVDAAFFSATPFSFENFCQTQAVGNLYAPSGTLCWEYSLPQRTLPPAPFVIALPTFWVRGVYFFWALAAGYYLFTEILQIIGGLKHYFAIPVRPLVKPQARV